MVEKKTEISIEKEVHRTNILLRKLIRTHSLWYVFLKGTVYGLGTAIGATAVLALVIYLLSRAEVIPVIGNWFAEINRFIQSQTQ